MSAHELSKLKSVDLRETWAHETQHFTPWLAENLDRLSEELGVDLELEGKEVYVEGYWADIVAQVPQDGTRVLIENQLEAADLKHLGQVLTYLAGLKAQIAIWVAKNFDDAQLSAIRWLNDHTVDPFAFFAVRVRVVRIGDSPLAPVFDVVERPNEWDRQVQQVSREGELSKIGQFRRDFWAHFASRLPGAPGLRPGYADSNVRHRVDQADVYIAQYLASGDVGIYLVGNRNETLADASPRIDPYVPALRATLDDPSFRNVTSGGHRCCTWLTIDSHDRGNWDQMVDWLDERRQTYERVLRSEATSAD